MPDTLYRGEEFRPKLKTSDHSSRGRRIQRRIRNVRRAVYGMFYRGCYWVLPRLPIWSVRLLGRSLIIPISRRLHWKTAESNLIKVYGDELDAAERKRILTKMFRDLPEFLVECVSVMKHGAEHFLDRIDDESARALIARLEAESPKGWIGITPHLGNWVTLATWASSLPGDRGRCHAIAKRQPNPHLSAVIDDIQERMNFTPIYTDEHPMQVVSACLRHLKKGARLGIAPDQDAAKAPGVFIDFLGYPAYTSTGPAQLALTVDVPLVPLAFVRNGDRFEIIHGDPIYPERDTERTRQQELVRLTRAWSEAIETMIHERKDHWAWFHERWKTTPEKLAQRGRALPQSG